MKVIDLLNRIANGEKVPEKIKFEYLEYELLPEKNDYYCSERMRWFTNEINVLGGLNDEVEVIEEDKKIKKFEFGEIEDREYYEIKRKINEIIDVLNEMREDK